MNPIKEALLKIFTLFSFYYPGQWRMPENELMEEVQLNCWHEAVEKFSISSIERAGKEAYKHHVSFPPTVGEFANLCKMYRDDERRRDELKNKLENAHKIKSIEDLTKLKPKSQIQADEMAKIRLLLSGKKIESLQPRECRQWQKEAIDRSSKVFCLQSWNERKEYLLSLSDEESLSLPLNDRFDRLSYLPYI